MAYQAPSNLMEVMQKIQFEDALSADDERYVPTLEARGSQKTYTRLVRLFGFDPNSGDFFPPATVHMLFFGHVGSGKTTELRRYARQLDDSRKFYVVEVDVIAKLDRNNLQYSETLLAMAEGLAEQLIKDGYTVADAALQPIRDWFLSAVNSRSQQNEYAAEIRSEIEAGGGLPGLFKLLSRITAAAKTGSSYKREWREEVRNRFSALADAFNSLLGEVEQLLAASGRAQRVIFLLDGTDKMKGEDTEQFFVQDAEQLLAINTFVIYTAPLPLKYSGKLVGKLKDLVLPMIKLYEKDGSPFPAGRQAMRGILLQRADRGLFADEVQIDALVELSGGHPRELLNLLSKCCEVADDGVIDAEVVRNAAKLLAADYRRFLSPDDYKLLASLDRDPLHGGNTEQIQKLLYRLALLEYNDGSWRRSHPVVRLLDGYVAAQQALAAAGTP